MFVVYLVENDSVRMYRLSLGYFGVEDRPRPKGKAARAGIHL
jgi:hypothetical protein